MDNLSYHYKANTNQLHKVSDAAADAAPGDYSKYNDIKQGQGNNNYQYDEIGNLVSDASESLTNITWTVYGKIASITKGGAVIRYVYDASGNRIFKYTATDTTAYVRDASGNVLSVYTRTTSTSLQQTETHLYGSARLGIKTAQTVPDSVITLSAGFIADGKRIFTRAEKIFELSNHLGNVLVTLSDRRVQHSAGGTMVDYYRADVASANDYYPFGMMMPKRSTAGAFGYRYGFNGKENDNDVKGLGNQQDYGMRIYDNRLGRFLSVDPISSEYPSLTPYQFASNRPIDGIDLDGLEYVPHIFGKQDYDGSWGIFDWAKAIPNAAANIGNGAIDIYNSGVSNYVSIRKGTWRKDVNRDFTELGKAIKTDIKQSYEYATTTPVGQQIREQGPRVLEMALTFWGSSKFVPGNSKGNLLKVETKTPSVTSELPITTNSNLFGGNSIALIEGRTTTVIGRFVGGVEHVKATGQFRTGINAGGVNILNVKNWSWEVNLEWLNAAIKRNDVIRVVTDPRKVDNIWENGLIGVRRTNFGKEVEVLEKAGYIFDGKNQFIKPKK